MKLKPRFANGETEKDVIKRMIGRKPDGFGVAVINEFAVDIYKDGIHRVMIDGSGTTIEKCVSDIEKELREKNDEETRGLCTTPCNQQDDTPTPTEGVPAAGATPASGAAGAAGA